MLELTVEQVAVLAEIDARGFVERVRWDLLREEPGFTDDLSLGPRLWRAFNAARALGVKDDANFVAFLRIEAYAPSFYDRRAMRAWLARPGDSTDLRFRDYLRVMEWRIEHPEFVGGMTYGNDTRALAGGRGRGAWPRLAERWQSIVRWCGNGGGR